MHGDKKKQSRRERNAGLSSLSKYRSASTQNVSSILPRPRFPPGNHFFSFPVNSNLPATPLSDFFWVEKHHVRASERSINGVVQWSPVYPCVLHGLKFIIKKRNKCSLLPPKAQGGIFRRNCLSASQSAKNMLLGGASACSFRGLIHRASHISSFPLRP